MKARFVRSATLALVLLLAGAAQAQGARSAALAGTTFPGIDYDANNPASLALPAAPRSFELALPLGALQYFASDWANPMLPTFDALPVLNQLNDLNNFLLRVPRSPEEISVVIDGDGLAIRADGTPITLPRDFALSQRVDLPLRFGVGRSWQLGIRPYADIRIASTQALSVTVGDDGLVPTGLAPAVASPVLRAELDLSATATAEAGVAIEVATAIALPGEGEVGENALGIRAGVLIGLAYAHAEASATVASELGIGDGIVGDVNAVAEGTLALGGLLDGGVGVGVVVDIGWIGTLTSQNGPVYVALLAERVGVTRWSGTRTAYALEGLELVETGEEEFSEFVWAPFSVSLAIAGRYDEAIGLALPDGGAAHAAVNLAYSQAGGLRGSVATEVGLGGVSLRAGVGYEAGLRYGVGLGIDSGPAGLDVALSGRQGPLGDLGLGVSASLRFVWGR